jgi:hypothetical protein
MPDEPEDLTPEQMCVRLTADLHAMTIARDRLQIRYDAVVWKLNGIAESLDYLSSQCRATSNPSA